MQQVVNFVVVAFVVGLVLLLPLLGTKKKKRDKEVERVTVRVLTLVQKEDYRCHITSCCDFVSIHVDIVKYSIAYNYFFHVITSISKIYLHKCKNIFT